MFNTDDYSRNGWDGLNGGIGHVMRASAKLQTLADIIRPAPPKQPLELQRLHCAFRLLALLSPSTPIHAAGARLNRAGQRRDAAVGLVQCFE